MTVPPIANGFALLKWDDGVDFHVVASGPLNPGTTYKIFLLADVLSGSAGGSCFFVESPVTLSFLPSKNTDVSPAP